MTDKLMTRADLAEIKHDDDALPLELVKAMAMDIGKELVAYIEIQYPQVLKFAPSTFKTSIRNHVYNDIMATIDVSDPAEIYARLDRKAALRRNLIAAYRKMRKS